jgi:type VI secretion system secreted protein VgrG
VGDEVIIQFLGDDPDQPIITGGVYNGVKPPASFQNASALPADKTMSGLRSKMHAGQGSNELILDDTTHELRTTFSTDHAATALHLGHLVHPRSGGVADPKGEGFELRTDAWGALRAEKGLLITTDGRSGASGHHADPQELTAQTRSAIELTKALSDTSENHQAGKLAVNDQTKGLKQTAEATKAHPNGDQQENVAAFGTSILGLSSPAGIVEGTPGTIVKSTGKHFQLTSGQDTNLAVGRRLVMAIQDAWSVLAAKGIKLFAGKGDVAIQAHEGAIHLLAEKETQLIACKQGADLAAGQKITLASMGAKVELAGGSITFITPGKVNCKAKWNVVMAQAKSYDMPNLVKEGEVLDHGFVIRDQHGNPQPDVHYELTTPEGKKLKGYTDANGMTIRVSSCNPAAVKIDVLKV